MTISTDGSEGQALIVPCLTTEPTAPSLFAEAEALWQAEALNAQGRRISALWGCVGVRFRNEPPPHDWSSLWTAGFLSRQASPVAPVNNEGFLDIPWPDAVADGPTDVDLILATATKPEEYCPSPKDIADAWIDQNNGHERYFFENVRYGIRTPDDLQIWKQIEERKPAWLSGDAYRDAIAVLRSGTRSRV